MIVSLAKEDASDTRKNNNNNRRTRARVCRSFLYWSRKTSFQMMLSSSFIRKRDLPTPPPSLSDVNDSSSCSSTASSSSSLVPARPDTNATVASCDLLKILADARFRPVFQAIDEIKRRKCRPDFERILKCVAKHYTAASLTEQRNEVLAMLDDLLKCGLISKVFHKGGFTIRIQNEKYAKFIENMSLCYNQKTPSAIPMSAHEAMAAALAQQSMLSSSEDHACCKRETPSPEFAVFTAGKIPRCLCRTF